jgi:hypothetical protein
VRTREWGEAGIRNRAPKPLTRVSFWVSKPTAVAIKIKYPVQQTHIYTMVIKNIKYPVQHTYIPWLSKNQIPGSAHIYTMVIKKIKYLVNYTYIPWLSKKSNTWLIIH